MEETFSKPAFGYYYLYILECSKKRFYVGISKDPKRRLKEHKEGTGAKFTCRHRPVKLYGVKPLGPMSYDEALKYENLCTLLWKKEFGAGKVVGGDYCHMSISKSKVIHGIDKATKEDLKKVIRPSTNKKKIKNKRVMRRIDCLANAKFRGPKLGEKTGHDGMKSLIIRKCTDN